MSKLTEIATGWYLFVTAPDSFKPMIKERLEICDGCEYKEQLSPTGIAIIHSINKAGSIYKCGHCQCPLAAAAASPAKRCPLGKW